MKRRKFVKNTSSIAGLMCSGALFSHDLFNVKSKLQKAVKITSGSKQQWFGYYDKFQVDKSGRYVLVGKVDTFFRSPTIKDKLSIGIIDLENEFKVKWIGSSNSWGWQQGCMLQWIPGSENEIIWNDREKGKLISRIYSISNGSTRTLPKPIYTISPDGSFALTLNFERLQFFRPGYGYPGIKSSINWSESPDNDGIFKMDLHTGKSQMIISLDNVARITRSKGSVKGFFHWFNHLLVSPDSNRFIFLNRSRPILLGKEMSGYLSNHPELNSFGFDGPYITRAMTANTDGSEIYPLNDEGFFSHFIWDGNDVITAWAVPDAGGKNAFYNFRDKTDHYEIIGKNIMDHNGHNTYVPNTNNEWILNDTYPLGTERLQELYLFHVPSNRKVSLGKFYEPPQYKGEWRCDLHPRCNQEGTKVFFDSSHEGNRQIYMMDIKEIVRS